MNQLPLDQPSQNGAKPTAAYTAGQWAGMTGRAKQAFFKGNLGYPASSSTLVPGGKALTWTFDALSPSEQLLVTRHAAKAGLSVSDYAESSSRPWQPKIGWAKSSSKVREKAEKLKVALRQSIQRRLQGGLSQGDQAALGIADFKLAFGYAINERTWRRLMGRTLLRAQYDEDYERDEIYLDDMQSAGVEEVTIPLGLRDELKPLRSLIQGITKAGKISGRKKRQVYDDAFLIFDRLADKEGRISAKREVLAFLCKHASFLASNAAALRRSFDRIYQKHLDGGRTLAALDDARSGRARGPELSEKSFLRLVDLATRLGNGMNGAWREMIRTNELEPETVAYYSQSLRKMPRKYRKQISAYVKDGKMRRHGARHAKLNGAYANRDPNHPAAPLHSGDFDQSDDYTFVNVMWDTLPDGSLYVGQPQLLLWTDERSWLPMGFVLIPDRSYNSFDIRNSWTVKCDKYGLPRKGLYLEGSFWQTARAWVGKKDEVGWSETEQGIRRMGVEIHHSTIPRGKLIEAIFRKLQHVFQAEPGYVGTNPHSDRYEDVQKQIRLVKSGDAKPSDFGWLSKEQWKVRLGELIVLYANEPMYGKYHEGLTPRQAYEKFFSTDLIHIPEECRHLLACNKIEGVRIGRNGLSFQYGKRRFTYKSEEIGLMKMRNQLATVWFNPENPEICHVTDDKGENPITVRHETSLPCHYAPPELMRQAFSENASLERHAKEVYASVQHAFSEEFEKRRFRGFIPDGGAIAAVEREAEFKQQKESINAEDRAKASLVTRAERAGRMLGVKLAKNDPKLDRRARGLELMNQNLGSTAEATSDT
jgi:hypothetical protein